MDPTRLCALLCVVAACGPEPAGVPGGGRDVPVEPLSLPTVDVLTPSTVEGGVPFVLSASGQDFRPGDALTIDGAAYPTQLVDAHELRVDIDGLPRGAYEVSIVRGDAATEPLPLDVTNSVPVVINPGAQELAEDQPFELTIDVSDFDGDDVRVFATNLPAGATWDERTLRFRPDFIQGGDSWEVGLTFDDGWVRETTSFTVSVDDTIAPPLPEVVGQADMTGHKRLKLEQVTDDYLDSPGLAGRSFEARVVVPTDASSDNRYPVRVYLHGLGGSPYTGGNGDQFRIYAHDPQNSYWWGYSDALPDDVAGTVPNYTQRRVLHLVEWVLRNYPGADPERVYVVGSSMGGAGALALGLLHGRHFCYAHGTLGQTIAANHRPARIDQLSGLWGSPDLDLPDETGMGNWTRGDLTRAVFDEHEARNQFAYTKHGKDDPTIHFGAVSLPSHLTGLSFFDAAQQARIGHYMIWDEGGHGSSDPVLGSDWWGGWDRVFDDDSYLRRDLPFPAFTNSSHDDDHGGGEGNGQQDWSDNAGFAGNVAVPGDTGWSGTRAGAINRHLRWDSNAIVDTIDALEMPLQALDGQGEAPSDDYPATGDWFDGGPLVVDVTIRRAQAFLCRPGEAVLWSFGQHSGVSQADGDGAVTIEALPIGTSYQTLRLSRSNLRP